MWEVIVFVLLAAIIAGLALALNRQRQAAVNARAAEQSANTGREHLREKLSAALRDLDVRTSEKEQLRSLFDAARAESDRDKAELRAELDGVRDARASAEARVAELEARLEGATKHFADKEAALRQQQEEAKQGFLAILDTKAAQLLEEKGQAMTQQNAENLKGVLGPLGQELERLQKQVNETHTKEREMHASILERIQSITEASQTVSNSTNALAQALSCEAKFQGDWGELQLTRILESVGFVEGREFDTQRTFEVDGKKLRPDCVLRLPQSRSVVVDAKVTLKAFHAYTEESDPEERQRLAKHVVHSFKAHVDGLAYKYAELPGVQQLDRVWMFVPVEAAYALVLREWPDFMSYAAKRGVMPVMASSLMVCLAVVEEMWKQEQQADDATKVLDQATKLYDKFRGFVEAMLEVESKIGGLNKSFETAKARLYSGSGNVISRVESLNELRGVTPRKVLPAKALERAREIGPTIVRAGSA
ncbi:MAG: DNA recombination protein RmuC [Myxococcota bacterium]